jgi:VanZ family protein
MSSNEPPGRVTIRKPRFSIPLFLVNIVYAVGVLMLALMPTVPNPGFEVPDVAAHAMVYGIQVALLFAMLRSIVAAPAAVGLAWLGATVFGLVTESLQAFQPDRMVELRDIVANGAGATLVGVVILFAGWVFRSGDDR